MNIPKAVGQEALALVLTEIKALKARVKVKERLEVKEKAEAHLENKVTVASGAAKVLVVETPALTNMIHKSAVVRLKEKGKVKSEEETPRPQVPADALRHRRKRNASNMKKATVLRVEIVRMRIPLRADSFLKVNAKTVKTANMHTLSPSTPMQGPTLVTTPVELGMSARGNLQAKQKQRQKGKVTSHTLRRLFLE